LLFASTAAPGLNSWEWGQECDTKQLRWVSTAVVDQKNSIGLDCCVDVHAFKLHLSLEKKSQGKRVKQRAEKQDDDESCCK
jgi:hypothetical protein